MCYISWAITPVTPCSPSVLRAEQSPAAPGNRSARKRSRITAPWVSLTPHTQCVSVAHEAQPVWLWCKQKAAWHQVKRNALHSWQVAANTCPNPKFYTGKVAENHVDTVKTLDTLVPIVDFLLFNSFKCAWIGPACCYVNRQATLNFRWIVSRHPNAVWLWFNLYTDWKTLYLMPPGMALLEHKTYVTY